MKDTNGTRKRTKKQVEHVDTVPLVPVEMLTPAARHNARMAKIMDKRPAVDAANTARLLNMMRHGAIPTDICDDATMPRFGAFRAAMASDDTFADDYASAYAVMCDMVLEDAALFARDSSDAGNIDCTRIAETYAKSMTHILEKLAPRTHGVLVKHAGADAGPLTVAVINYGDHKQVTSS